MSDIKFRAWDEKDNEMFYSNTYQDKTSIVFGLSNFLRECSDIEDTLMQYTGLKDKNGVEIYEGDIIMFEDDKDFIYLIEFCEGAYGWFNYKGKTFSNFVSFESMTYSDKEHFRVVGNKYQNKDLLLNI